MEKPWMDSGFEEIYRCQRLLRLCVIAVVAVFWIPFILLAADVTENRQLNNVLGGLVLGGPLVVTVATVWLSVQFLRSIPDSALGSYWPILLIALVTVIPFFNLLGPVGCLQQVQRFLGRDPAVLPTALPNRRCRCGASMTLVGGTQLRKMIGNVPVGYLATFACGRCSRRIQIPSLEMMILNGVVLLMAGLLIFVGWAWVHDFVRQPAADAFGVLNVVLVLLVALILSALVLVYAFRLLRQLTNRFRFPEQGNL